MLGISIPPALAGWLLRGVLVLAIMAAGAAAWDRFPVIGAHAQKARVEKARDDYKAAAEDWKRAAEGWEASFRASEKVRREETSTARTAINLEAQACTARVAEARRSALSIRALTRQEPRRDPQGCPIRQLVPSGQLRDALQGPGPSR